MHTTDVPHSAGVQVGQSKNAALNVDRILEIPGPLGKQRAAPTPCRPVEEDYWMTD